MALHSQAGTAFLGGHMADAASDKAPVWLRSQRVGLSGEPFGYITSSASRRATSPDRVTCKP